MHDQVHNRRDSVNERQPEEVDPIVLCVLDARTNNLPYSSGDVIGASLRFSGSAIAEGRAARLTSTWWPIASACANNEIWRRRFAAVQRHPRFGSQRAAEAHGKTMNHPPRAPWGAFPDAIILAAEPVVKSHPEYAKAKSGDIGAARVLVAELVSQDGLEAVKSLLPGGRGQRGLPTLVSAHAHERGGINAIPVALATLLGTRLGLPSESTVVQTNVVSHTGASGYGRLARQARFSGELQPGREYVLVDDFVGQGGTLANLRGWIHDVGGKAVGAIVLTGKEYSARLSPSKEQLDALRERHGVELEQWWRDQFGHSFDCLTQSEARYLERSPNAETIRNRLASAKQEGDGRSNRGGGRNRGRAPIIR